MYAYMYLFLSVYVCMCMCVCERLRVCVYIFILSCVFYASYSVRTHFSTNKILRFLKTNEYELEMNK